MKTDEKEDFAFIEEAEKKSGVAETLKKAGEFSCNEVLRGMAEMDKAVEDKKTADTCRDPEFWSRCGEKAALELENEELRKKVEELDEMLDDARETLCCMDERSGE